MTEKPTATLLAAERLLSADTVEKLFR